MNLREVDCVVDGTGSGSCLLAGFSVSVVEPQGYLLPGKCLRQNM
jgi:hypothetical protein